MDTTQHTWNSSEIKTLFDCGTGKPGADRPAYGPPEPGLMNNLYSILTLSLIFYERITKPFTDEEGERIVPSFQGPGLES